MELDFLGMIGGGFLNIFVIVFTIFFIGGIVGLITWAILNRKKYKQFKCVIWERDGFGQLKQGYDDAGIFVDRKTKNKRLFLKKNKVGLNPDVIPYLQSQKLKTIYLYRTGLKNFHFIKVGIQDPKITLTVGEEDVNWAINSYERAKKVLANSIWMQILPYAVIAVVSMVIMVIFIFFFKEFGTLRDMSANFAKAAEAMKAVAEQGLLTR
jgi:uncharacterized membrane protein